MNSTVDEKKHLEVYALSNRQPVQVEEDGGYVLSAGRLSNKAGSVIMKSLDPTELLLCRTDEEAVVVVDA